MIAMDYTPGDDLRMVAESVGRFVADRAGANGDPWPQMAELGLPGLPLPDASGGSGLGAAGTMVVMEAFGAGLLATPFVPSVVMAGSLLSRCPAEGGRIAALIAGQARFACALPDGAGKVPATARAGGDGRRLTGRGILVLGAETAGAVLVPAWQENGEAGFFLLSPDGAGVRLHDMTLADGRRAARMDLSEAAPMTHLRPEGEPGAILRALHGAALLAVAAENLGAMQRLFDLTLGHVKTRSQFGRPIGAFQTLQFRLVDLWIRLDEARSLVMTATMAADAGAADAARLAAAAWIQTLWSGRAISEEAIQLHGALGMTEESVIGRYVKRILVNELLFGPPEAHLARFSGLPRR